MAEQTRRSTRRQKIEPLNYAEAALAPALKGMTSFLDLSPEDVRNGNFAGLASPNGTVPLHAPELESPPGAVSSPGHQTSPTFDSKDRARLTVIPLQVRGPAATASPGGETPPGDRTGEMLGAATVQPGIGSLQPLEEREDEGIATSESGPAGYTTAGALASPDGSSPPGGVSSPGNATDLLPVVGILGPLEVGGNEISYFPATTLVHNATAAPVSYPSHVSSPGYGTTIIYGEENTVGSQYDLVPGRGRSKVRRCVLAQDGHSLGEEAIYQVLWRTGNAESSDPNSSRTNRLGAAEIGYKVNMAKKNVRQNVARLFEKLAIEIIEDFGTMNSQARLYRVFSYKQILERRRAAGMEYVLRNKGVVFCDRNGTEMQSSPAHLSTPGDETIIRPAKPKKRRLTPKLDSSPVYPEVFVAEPAKHDDAADLQAISVALNRYWTVDDAAAVQLLRDCRRVRPDARADEIAFFVHEKLQLARTNRNITNPVGLIIATVPQSFTGFAFEEFRRRMERQAALAAEETQRRKRETDELNAWMQREREKLIAIASDTSIPEATRSRAEQQLRQYGFLQI